jgi:hypothetical protein
MVEGAKNLDDGLYSSVIAAFNADTGPSSAGSTWFDSSLGAWQGAVGQGPGWAVVQAIAGSPWGTGANPPSFYATYSFVLQNHQTPQHGQPEQPWLTGDVTSCSTPSPASVTFV